VNAARGGDQVQRLVVVADNSLILEAISTGLRHSGEFKVLGHINARTASWRAIVDASPDVVLVDDMERSDEALDLIREVTSVSPQIAIIVLTIVMDAVSGHVVHRYKRLGPPGGQIARPRGSDDSALTLRELEVLRLVAAGSTNGEIARNLWVTEQTVKFHLSNVYRKLDVGNRTEASHYAHVNGLVSPPLVVVS
jgi:DNA-binding NarL/FixJ family response regulator